MIARLLLSFFYGVFKLSKPITIKKNDIIAIYSTL